MVCKTCGGTSYITSTINGAPFGGGYWPMDIFEPCPDCVENGKCPRCDKEMTFIEDTSSYRCLNCGWDEASGLIIEGD